MDVPEHGTRNGPRGKARGVSHGPAEYLKLRLPLPPSAEFTFFFFFFARKSLFWESLTQLQILFQDVLRAETSISNLAAQSVILIRSFSSGAGGSLG